MTRLRGIVRVLFCLAIVCAAGTAARAAGYPSRPIHLVISYQPGGIVDFAGRVLAQQLGAVLGQSVVVDNRPGAGGIVGVDSVAHAAPDGYDLVLIDPSIVTNPVLHKTMPFDVFKDLTPISLVGSSPDVLVVAPQLGIKSFAALVAYGKANPGKLAFATPGAGTPPHMIGEMFRQHTGLDITAVPYKSGGSSTQDVVSGQVALTFENPAVALPLALSGQLRALAVTSDLRNPRIPDVPTLSETVPDFVSVSFTGMVAPAGVSPAIVDKLNAAINASLKAPAVQATLAKLSVDIKPGSAEDFAAFLAREKAKWLAVARAAKIELD